MKCPRCGTRGRAKDLQEETFEVRGQVEGRPVRKCRVCGAGLLVGSFGRARLIPEDVWRKMEAEWERNFPADESRQPGVLDLDSLRRNIAQVSDQGLEQFEVMISRMSDPRREEGLAIVRAERARRLGESIEDRELDDQFEPAGAGDSEQDLDDDSPASLMPWVGRLREYLQNAALSPEEWAEQIAQGAAQMHDRPEQARESASLVQLGLLDGAVYGLEPSWIVREALESALELVYYDDRETSQSFGWNRRQGQYMGALGYLTGRHLARTARAPADLTAISQCLAGRRILTGEDPDRAMVGLAVHQARRELDDFHAKREDERWDSALGLGRVGRYYTAMQALEAVWDEWPGEGAITTGHMMACWYFGLALHCCEAAAATASPGPQSVYANGVGTTGALEELRHPPRIWAAREVRRYRLGPLQASLLTDAQAEGEVSYEHLLAAFEPGHRPCLIVGAEKTIYETRALGVFTAGGHEGLEWDVALGDIDEFARRALELAADRLNIEEAPEPLA